MDQRATLNAGEDHLVDGCGKFLGAEHKAGARAAQGLVRGAGDYVAMGHRRRMHAARDQAGYVGHVDYVFRADAIGDLAHPGKINNPGVGASAADDQLGPLALGDLLQFVVVDGLGVFAHTVGDDFVHLAGKIQRMAVSQVASVGQIQAKDGIAWLQQSHEGRHVGL